MNKNLNDLTEQELDLYIGKTTRQFMQLRVDFEKANLEYIALNTFLANKFKNVQPTNETPAPTPGLMSVESIDSFLKQVQKTDKLKDKICDFANEIGIENLNGREMHPILKMDQDARKAKSLELVTSGQVGRIKRYEIAEITEE